jgi:hypothetical protein
MFPNPGPGDNGDEPEEDEDMHSYAAAAGYQNESPPDVASLMLHMRVVLHCQRRQKECSIMKPSWQMDQSPTPESQQGS